MSDTDDLIYIKELEAKLAAAEADIQRLVSEAVEREELFQAEREKVKVLLTIMSAIITVHDMPATVLKLAREALATTAPEGGEV